jgi:hypothetical protein
MPEEMAPDISCGEGPGQAAQPVQIPEDACVVLNGEAVPWKDVVEAWLQREDYLRDHIRSIQELSRVYLSFEPGIVLYRILESNPQLQEVVLDAIMSTVTGTATPEQTGTTEPTAKMAASRIETEGQLAYSASPEFELLRSSFQQFLRALNIYYSCSHARAEAERLRDKYPRADVDDVVSAYLLCREHFPEQTVTVEEIMEAIDSEAVELGENVPNHSPLC